GYVTFLSLTLISTSEHPVTQHLPIPLATTAAWEVIPPCVVTIASLATIPSISSGEVSGLINITLYPCSALNFAVSAENTISQLAAPGLAGSPIFETAVALSSALSSKLGCNNCSIDFTSTFITASFLEIIPSSTKSTAI